MANISAARQGAASLVQPLSRPFAEVPRQSVLFHARESGPAWRLIHGCLRLDRITAGQHQLVQLALPGDWVGLEAVTQGHYQLQAQALTPCVVQQVDAPLTDGNLWSRAWAQQQQRHVHMTQLRTGKVADRIEYLLELLDLDGERVSKNHSAWPPLREIAEVVDATVETVCRVLAKRAPTTQPRGLRWLMPTGPVLFSAVN